MSIAAIRWWGRAKWWCTWPPLVSWWRWRPTNRISPGSWKSRAVWAFWVFCFRSAMRCDFRGRFEQEMQWKRDWRDDGFNSSLAERERWCELSQVRNLFLPPGFWVLGLVMWIGGHREFLVMETRDSWFCFGAVFCFGPSVLWQVMIYLIFLFKFKFFRVSCMKESELKFVAMAFWYVNFFLGSVELRRQPQTHHSFSGHGVTD